MPSPKTSPTLKIAVASTLPNVRRAPPHESRRCLDFEQETQPDRLFWLTSVQLWLTVGPLFFTFSHLTRRIAHPVFFTGYLCSLGERSVGTLRYMYLHCAVLFNQEANATRLLIGLVDAASWVSMCNFMKAVFHISHS